MAITTQVNGSNRTVTLTYEALKVKVDPTLAKAAEWIYTTKGRYHIQNPDQTDKVYDDLTNQEKLNVIDKAVKGAIIHWAKSKFITEETFINRAETEIEANENYDL